jgi:hypothetical protein
MIDSGIFSEGPAKLNDFAEQPSPRLAIPKPIAEVFRKSRLLIPFRSFSMHSSKGLGFR